MAIPNIPTQNKKQEQSVPSLEIFTDGACIPNPGHMGVGIVFGGEANTLSQYFGIGTNQVSELLAVKTALAFARPGDKIFSDSHYAINLATAKWRAWTHFELIKDIRILLERKRVAIHWIRGHRGHRLQEMADRLAKRAAKTRRSRIDSPSNLLSGMGLGGFGHDGSEIPCS